MRNQTDESSGFGTGFTLLLFGIGIGALLGMVYAPKTGKAFRKDLRRKYDEARESLDEIAEQARDLAEEAMERGSELADEFRERVTPLAKSIRRR